MTFTKTCIFLLITSCHTAMAGQLRGAFPLAGGEEGPLVEKGEDDFLGRMLDTTTTTTTPFSDFCWKDTYGRGWGTIPKDCPAGKEKIGAFCYPECPAGYERFGFDCHQICTRGWDDQGLFCRDAEYGRGAGYPWKFGDGLNDDGMFERCERDHGKGRCEKHLAIVYPKCRDGYSPFGCCICRPEVPKCSDYGMNPGIDLSCAKKIIIGSPSTLTCAEDEDQDIGLCYQRCRPGYNGVGPVCWAESPDNWVGCGMGSATSSTSCAAVIGDQVFSVGFVAYKIGTGLQGPGGSGNRDKMLEVLEDWPAMKQSVKELLEKGDEVAATLREALVAAKPLRQSARAGWQTGSLLDAFFQSDEELQLEPEDIARIILDFVAIFDQTGLAGLASAFTYPKCSAYFGLPDSDYDFPEEPASCEIVDSCNPGIFENKRWSCPDSPTIPVGQTCPSGWTECIVGANRGTFEGKHWVCPRSHDVETGESCSVTGTAWIEYHNWRALCKQPSCQVFDSCNPGSFNGKRWTCPGNHNVRVGESCRTGWEECQVGANPLQYNGKYYVCSGHHDTETGGSCPDAAGWIEFDTWKSMCGLE